MAKSTGRTRKIQGIVIGKRNIYLFVIGLLVIAMGFIFMAQPPVDGFLSLTLAPVLLVLGYLVIIPISIFIKDNKGG